MFEWHENQVLTEKFFHISDKIDFSGIFVFHFVNAFSLIITLNILFVTDTFLVAILYGFVLGLSHLFLCINRLQGIRYGIIRLVAPGH